MRKSIQFFLTLVLIFAWCNIFAQENVNSAGKIPSMKLERVHTIVNLPENPASIAYGWSSINLTTLSMPIPAGTPFTNLAPWTAPVFASSMIKGGNGTYYMTEVGPPAALYIFNPAGGAVTFHVNITGLQGADQPNGIAYNAANGMYYLAAGSLSPVSDNIYTVDVNTGVATLVGGTGTAGLQIDLGITQAGVCYSYDLVNNNGYTINLSTGAATLLGPLGYDPNYGQGMSIDNETGTVYLSAFDNGTTTGQLRTMNVTTGNTTLIVDWGFDQIAPFALDTQYGPTPTITVTSPNGGEVWQVGSIKNINWSSSNVIDVKIELSINNGASWIEIISSTPSTGLYAWTVPNSPSLQCLIKISDVTDPNVNDVSDNVFTIEQASSIEDFYSSGIPSEFKLYQNFPNPFNPNTTIYYSIAKESFVKLNIYNLLGEVILETVKEYKNPGNYAVNINLENYNSGLYFYQLKAGSFVESKKMLLLK